MGPHIPSGISSCPRLPRLNTGHRPDLLRARGFTLLTDWWNICIGASTLKTSHFPILMPHLAPNFAPLTTTPSWPFTSSSQKATLKTPVTLVAHLLPPHVTILPIPPLPATAKVSLVGPWGFRSHDRSILQEIPIIRLMLGLPHQQCPQWKLTFTGP